MQVGSVINSTQAWKLGIIRPKLSSGHSTYKFLIVFYKEPYNTGVEYRTYCGVYKVLRFRPQENNNLSN